MATGTIPYDEPIDKNTDWGGDSSTGGRPVAGGRVQDFIKGTLQNLEDKIKNISGLGRFLSGWDCTTGLAVTNPSENPYKYPVGSFYIVAKVGERNYRPSGTAYGIGAASTVLETGNVKVNDIYKYDGTSWMLIELDNPEIPNFTNETAGLIRGKEADGYIEAEDGFGKVHGWDTKMDVVGNATNETAGLMSSTDKEKLDGLENYILPPATSNKLGGVKGMASPLMVSETGHLSIRMATDFYDGCITAADKIKLNNLSFYTDAASKMNLERMRNALSYHAANSMPSVEDLANKDYIVFVYVKSTTGDTVAMSTFFANFIQSSLNDFKPKTVLLVNRGSAFTFVRDGGILCTVDELYIASKTYYEFSIIYEPSVLLKIIIPSQQIIY